MRKVEDRRWEVEKMRRWERLAAAKMMNIEYRILLRRTGVEGKTKKRTAEP
jgi:hypothetical protein